MDIEKAIGIAEGYEDVKNEEEIIEAWQYLIDSGACWKLQGWFGRTAELMINEKICKPTIGDN